MSFPDKNERDPVFSVSTEIPKGRPSKETCACKMLHVSPTRPVLTNRVEQDAVFVSPQTALWVEFPFSSNSVGGLDLFSDLLRVHL